MTLSVAVVDRFVYICTTSIHDGLDASMPSDDADDHHMAAVIVAHAIALVTRNRSDFPEARSFLPARATLDPALSDLDRGC